MGVLGCIEEYFLTISTIFSIWIVIVLLNCVVISVIGTFGYHVYTNVLEKMGWMLEVAKMFLYVSFPVGMFYYINQPAYFEKRVIKAKMEYFPPESRKMNQQLENFMQDYNSNIEKRRLDILESGTK